MIEALASPTSDVRALYRKYGGATENISVDPYMTAVFPKSAQLPLNTLGVKQKLTVFQTLYLVNKIGLIDGSGLPSDVQQSMRSNNGPPFDPYKC